MTKDDFIKKFGEAKGTALFSLANALTAKLGGYVELEKAQELVAANENLSPIFTRICDFVSSMRLEMKIERNKHNKALEAAKKEVDDVYKWIADKSTEDEYTLDIFDLRRKAIDHFGKAGYYAYLIEAHDNIDDDAMQEIKGILSKYQMSVNSISGNIAEEEEVEDEVCDMEVI